MATDRASGYGTEPQAQRAQSPATPSAVIDAYARSGATTGAASPGSSGTTAQSTARLAQRPASAPPVPMAILPESTAKLARRPDDQAPASTSTAIAPEDATTAERSQQRRRTGSVADPVASGNSRRDDAARKATTSASQEAAQPKPEPGDAAGPIAEAAAEADNRTARAGKPDEKWHGRRSARAASTRSWTRDDNYAVDARDGRDRNGFATFGPAPDARRGFLIRARDGMALPSSNRGTGGADITTCEKAAAILLNPGPSTGSQRRSDNGLLATAVPRHPEPSVLTTGHHRLNKNRGALGRRDLQSAPLRTERRIS
jgi:hypothetical protein